MPVDAQHWAHEFSASAAKSVLLHDVASPQLTQAVCVYATPEIAGQLGVLVQKCAAGSSGDACHDAPTRLHKDLLQHAPGLMAEHVRSGGIIDVTPVASAAFANSVHCWIGCW
jgi:hypothetical protein